MSKNNNKPVVFLAFANDRDDSLRYLRNLPDEARRLRDVLESVERAGLCDVLVRSNCTAEDIFKVFQDPQYRNRIAIFHFGGHANGYQLLLESATGQAVAANAGGLSAFLAQQQGMQLVFLNGCSTREQTQDLLDANIASVISTSRSIDDKVATDFAFHFYSGLASGTNIQTAYNEAEAAAQTSKGDNTREAYVEDPDASLGQPETDRWPWDLNLRVGDEAASQWNLPQAAGDPLFGLPPLSKQDLPDSPYRYLNWFTSKDAEVFFGRGRQIRELYDQLTTPQSAPILLFYGQSGVGKSSVLDAGLIPRLEQDCEIRYLRRSGSGLLETLQSVFTTEDSGAGIDAAWRDQESKTGQPLIVFLDQVEEVFTRPVADMPGEMGQFIQALKIIFDDPGRRPKGKLVLGFRKEYLAELEKLLSDSVQAQRGKVFLQPLDREGVMEVVRGPTESKRLQDQYGLTVEDDLPEIIADDLLEDRDSAIAPTLQILLTKLWDKAKEENEEQPEFTQKHYQKLKREGILLRDFLDQQITKFSEDYPDEVSSGLLLDLLASHTTALGTADHCDLKMLEQQYGQSGDAVSGLLQKCQDLHLLTVAASSCNDTEKVTRLAHDTLAPLVRERFDVSDLPGQRARRILDNRSVDWKDKQVGTPLDEADLAVVERGLNGTRTLDATEKRLLEASREQRARYEQQRRRRRNIYIVAVVLIVLAAFIAVFQSVIAKKQTRIAKEKTKIAKQQTELALKHGKIAIQNEKMLLAEKHRENPVFGRMIAREVPGRQKGWAAIASDLNRYRVPELLFGPGDDQNTVAKEVAFGPSGNVVVGNDINEVWLWPAKGSESTGPRRLGTHETYLWDVEFSLDGSTIASSDNNGVVRIWAVDRQGGTQERPSLSLGEYVSGAALRVRLSNDGGVAAVLMEHEKTRTVTLWHLGRGQPKRTLVTTTKSGDEAVSALAVSPDGTQLLLGYGSGKISSWRKQTDSENLSEKILKKEGSKIVDLAYNESGTFLGSIDDDYTVQWWSSDAENTDGGHSEDLVFLPIVLRLRKGNVFVAGMNEVYIGDLATGGDSLSFVPEFYKENIWDADFDGKRFITALEDHGEISIWGVNATLEPRVLKPNGDDCKDCRAIGAVYLDSERLLAAYQGGTVRVWSSLDLVDGDRAGSAEEPTVTQVIPPNTADCSAGAGPDCAPKLTAVAASVDGKSYATAFFDGSIIVGSIGGDAEAMPTKFKPPAGSFEQGENAGSCEFPIEDATPPGTRSGNDMQNSAWSIAFDHKAERLIVGYQDGRVLVFDRRDKSWTIVGYHERAVCAVDWGSGDDLLLSGSLDGKVKIWTYRKGAPASERKVLEQQGSIYAASFDAHSERVVTAASDHLVRIWDLTGDMPIEHKLKGYLDIVRAAVFSPDGNWVLSVGGNQMGISCLEPQSEGVHVPCEPGDKMIMINTLTPTRNDFRLARAVAISPERPQFASVDAAGDLSLFRNDYRVALWQQQSECLSVARRKALLSESSEQAEAGHKYCQNLVEICKKSVSACEKALTNHSLLN